MRVFSPLCLVVAALMVGGCLVVPVGKSGGLGSVTVPNTNASAIVSAASSVFPEYGYAVGPSNFPDSISFDKPAGGFGKLMFGSYDDTTTVRVKLSMDPIPGTSDIRLSPHVYTVSDAGIAGFDDEDRLTQLTALEFLPILKQISSQAGGAGPM